MDYESFKEKLRKKDQRNSFGASLLNKEIIVPKETKGFYQHVNPIDVEVVLDDLTSIKFFSLSDLNQIQQEYQLKEGFIFASREGDPLILKEGKVYMAAHGSTGWELEYQYPSFEAFLQSII